MNEIMISVVFWFKSKYILKGDTVVMACHWQINFFPGTRYTGKIVLCKSYIKPIEDLQ
jgi:hypothetical protein